VIACPQCGNQNPEDASFCDNCGARLTAGQQMPQQPPQQVPGQIQPEPGAAPTCPACGAQVIPGEAFCSECGASLTSAVDTPVERTPPGVSRLIVTGTNHEFELSGQQEYIVGREDPVSDVFPDVDLTNHGGEEGGVSRRHVKLAVQGARVVH